MWETQETADLLTDLALATGYGVCLIDQNALKPTGDGAAGAPRETLPCADCEFSPLQSCLTHWAVPDGERSLAHCPGGLMFACLPLQSEGAPAGKMLLGPLEREVAEDARKARALLSVMDAVAARMERLGQLTRRNDLFARLSRYIADHLTDEMTAEALHSALYASVSALAHAVKQETGMPLRLYVQARRLEAARLMLLGTSMTVMQVAEKCGISDFNYFARIFKKRYGMPPSALRRRRVQSPSEP